MIGDTILERASAHFTEQLQNHTGSVSVPEWGTTIYYRPMNGKQRDAILKCVNDGNLFEALVESIILRARDEDGKAMFRRIHKREFMSRIDPKVVERVASEMGTLDSALLDEEEPVPVKKS